MKLIHFPGDKNAADATVVADADATYQRLLARTVVAEDALLLIERTREKGYRLEPCQFDVAKFDPRDVCAGCPGLHFCTRQSRRRAAALQAMLCAQLNTCYTLLRDVEAALETCRVQTRVPYARLYARLHVDIALHTRDAEQRQAAEDAAELYQKLLTMSGEHKYHACQRACAYILAGDGWEARQILRQNGAFGDFNSEPEE